jgi:hypothetical protein
MSIDVHPGSPPAAFRDRNVAAESELERHATWAETTITVIATIVTIVFVSVVAVLMALA